MKRILICLLAICLTLPALAQANESYTYRFYDVESGKKLGKELVQFRKSDINPDYLIFSSTQEIDEQDRVIKSKSVVNQHFETIEHKVVDPTKKNDYVLKNQGTKVTIKGIYEGESIDKTYKIGSSPFFHDPSLCLSGFAQSGNKELVFQVINPEDKKMYEMIAKNKGLKKISIAGQKVEAVEVYWTLNDFRSMFFNQTFYFRASDGVFLTQKKPFNNTKSELVLN